MNQCKKKWNTLFDDFNNLKNFDPEVYKAIEEFVRVRDGRSESDPDVDPVVEKDVKCDELLVNVLARSGMVVRFFSLRVLVLKLFSPECEPVYI